MNRRHCAEPNRTVLEGRQKKPIRSSTVCKKSICQHLTTCQSNQISLQPQSQFTITALSLPFFRILAVLFRVAAILLPSLQVENGCPRRIFLDCHGTCTYSDVSNYKILGQEIRLSSNQGNEMHEPSRKWYYKWRDQPGHRNCFIIHWNLIPMKAYLFSHHLFFWKCCR